jgi:hypothetical protein
VTILPIVTEETETGVTTGSWINVAGIATQWTLKSQIGSMTNPTASVTPLVRFQFTDTVNAGTATLAGPTFSFLGTIGPSFDIVKAIKEQDFPDLRIGIANGLLRLDLTNINASTSISYSAWVEY